MKRGQSKYPADRKIALTPLRVGVVGLGIMGAAMAANLAVLGSGDKKAFLSARKVLEGIGEFAARLGVPTPLFSASAPVYAAAMAQGFGKADTAAVCAVLEALAGVKR